MSKVRTDTGWGFAMGAVNPEYKRFDYITDLIREYNEKTAASN